MKSLSIVTVLGVFSCAVVLIGQQRPQQPEATFRVHVDAVEVDAVVVDPQGNVVTDLTSDDFEVLEDGKPQTISSFALVNIPALREERPLFSERAIEPDVRSNNRGEGRLYVFAFEDVNRDQALRVRRFVRRFLEQYFGANDLAAVAFLGRQNTASTQDLTSSTRLLLNAVEAFTGALPEDAAPAPAIAGVQGATPVPSAEDFERRFAERRQMSSLRDLVEFMATIHGRRKALVLFSQGYPLEHFTVIDYRGGTLSLPEEDLHRAITAATRHNVTIYPIDPRGLTTEGGLAESQAATDTASLARLEASTSAMSARQTLSALADVTGGFALTNSNSFDDAFKRIVQEQSTYYVLGFSSTNERRDGRYRRLQVRVKRPGLVVRGRAGYMAARGNERRSDTPAAPANISAAVADALRSPIAVNGIPLRVFAAPYKGDAGQAIVVLSIEVDASQLGMTVNDGVHVGGFEVSYQSSDTRGKTYVGDTRTANLTMRPEVHEVVARTGMRLFTETRLPPGRYQVHVAAGNRAGRSGSVVYDLEVPDFTREPLALSGVSLFSPLESRVMTMKPAPVLSDALPGVATASREFQAGDTLVAFVEAYDNATSASGHSVELVAELRADGGRTVRRVAEQRSSQELQGRAGGYGFTAQLPLTDLAPGAYLLHVEAQSTAQGRPSASRDVQIQVR